MIYLLDSNSFIEANNRHYRMPVVPGFWEWLTRPHDNIMIQSIIPVLKELTKETRKPDELSRWAAENKALFIPVDDDSTQLIFKKIAKYVNAHQIYARREIGHFLAGADPWLIAAAKNLSACIVTHEVPVADDSKKVKIPNIAKIFDVEYLDVFDLLESNSVELILAN
ncbi:MAG TPA: DUF4411 family protein [Burkholderiaceae bacterium]|nr:DUF4411 family protein [Burkholderiaceae bacterium]